MTLTLSDFEKRWGPVYLLLQLLGVPFGAALVCALLRVPSVAAVNLLAFWVNGGLAAFFFRELLLRSVRSCARRWGRTLWIAAKGFCLYWIANMAVNILILTVRPDFANVNDAGVNAMIDEFPLLMSLAVVFAVPLAEECLFRGWIFTGLARRSLPLAYAVTVLSFAAVHVTGYIGVYDGPTLALCFLQYLAPAFVLCQTCREADSLCAPLLLHMTINTIALFTTR